ncbi:glycerol-3-phosphate responsive antiterminator [Paenibacillus apiarius]|uniref:glycerol-3-phosphate responsive antiterminator n=1 Tax=Paenibacillus apiarius TaxID=46240 RepID=UPI00198242F7|nr:glycerol-3-phosphate responsive antiterminator [Paenibacillus apiarius]MBN3525373.1 glycerol-3-phosphate responsive antiterminator [Paenibacillus apiarius]
MTNASRRARTLLIWFLGALIVLAAVPFLPSKAEAGGKVFPEKIFSVYEVDVNEDKNEPIPPTVTGATYQNLFNASPDIAEINVDLTQGNGMYTIHPKQVGTTTVQYEWKFPDDRIIVHKFTVTVTDGNLMPPRINIDQERNLNCYFLLNESGNNNMTISLDRLFTFSQPINWGNPSSLQVMDDMNLFVIEKNLVNSKDIVLKNSDRSGDTRVTITLTDIAGKKAVYYLDIATNWEPVPHPQHVHVLAQHPVTISLEELGLFTDADDDKLSFSLLVQPAFQARIEQDALIIQTDSTGETTLYIGASDGRRGSAIAELTVTSWASEESGVAGTYPETDNSIVLTNVTPGSYILAPMQVKVPAEAELNQLVSNGKARLVEVTDGSEVSVSVDTVNGVPELAAGDYGLYRLDGSIVSLEQVIHTLSKDVIWQQLKDIDARHENNGVDIMDARRWLFEHNNTYFYTKVVLSLIQ